MLGVSTICWAIWKARNNACFENKFIKSPLEIICHAGALMKFWAGLYIGLDREELEAGVNSMLKPAMDMLANKKNKMAVKEEDHQGDHGGGNHKN